jgi:hypothetical protein
MKKLLLTTLVVLSVVITYAQKQKTKAPATASTSPAPPVKTPPTAPPKPTPRKIKPALPPSLGIEKEIRPIDYLHPRPDTSHTHQ